MPKHPGWAHTTVGKAEYLVDERLSHPLGIHTGVPHVQRRSPRRRLPPLNSGNANVRERRWGGTEGGERSD